MHIWIIKEKWKKNCKKKKKKCKSVQMENFHWKQLLAILIEFTRGYFNTIIVVKKSGRMEGRKET
jgi:hypothetical protein